MERVQSNEDWCLMCPDICPGLSDVIGKDFTNLYQSYENSGKYIKKVKAQSIWIAIIRSQIETGTPYLCYKDAANNKSNQKNLGTIKSSNLCSEIIEYSDDNEYAVCNLASISLPMFIENGEFNLKELHRVSQLITKNLNKVIDRTFYPVSETSNSNLKHRPIGLGVQGLADVYAIMRFPFDSPEAAKLNRDIFETIYHGALTASIELAKELGPYSTYNGSPASQGLLQFDLWGKQPEGNWDWVSVKEELSKYGLRNSLLLAPMPTASTSQILGNTECFEPITSNIFQRQSMAGDFTIINKHLIADLIKLNLWNNNMKDNILVGGGSIQHIKELPNEIKMLYKTAWEIKQKVLIDQAADRGIYVCQSQSLNLFIEDPDISKISNMHFYAWKAGLKTGCYYLRTRPKAKMSSYTLEPPKATVTEAQLACSRDNRENCEMCSG
jgi:ribonucleoside-diphosphate reductase alpha subunit